MSKRCVIIDKKEYWVEQDEFKPIYYEEYCNLNILDDIEYVERIVALINDITDTMYPLEVVMDTSTKESFGGYFETNIRSTPSDFKFHLFCETNQSGSFMLLKTKTPRGGYHIFEWMIDKKQLYLYIHDKILKNFKEHFHWYISQNNKFTYDNLLHLTMIVKNSGDSFKTVLESYIPYIDRWTILDTGSTDNTVQIIKNTLGKRVRGELFQEPFINFRESRNRCLDLAGYNSKFLIMLDDTYVIKENLRGFLKKVRGDQFGESFGLFIQSKDMEYSSNRIFRTVYNLRYMYKIHEVPQENKCVMIPKQDAWIFDAVDDYMDKRTANRKQSDIILLQESIQEEPENPRHLYYMAQTYVCLEDYENAYKYFLRRFYHSNEGFFQEKFDAGFEAARIGQYRLNKPWEECLFLYNALEKIDPRRPEPSYFIGIYHYTQKNFKEAFKFMLRSHRLGFPVHAQFSLKPSLSFYFAPKVLAELCYSINDEPDAFKIGLEACQFFLSADYPVTLETPDIKQLMNDWSNIYFLLDQLKPDCVVNVPEKPYLCIVAPGNWKKWTGKSLDKDGLGGSETHTIEIANLFQNELERFNVIVFCNCTETIHNNISYKPVEQYIEFINENYVHTSIICRYSEFIPVTIHANVDNIIVMLHDVRLTGTIIPVHPKIRNFICLTEWHKELFCSQFSQFNNISTICHHGIDIDRFDKIYNAKPNIMGFRPRFIYSSFANRGLHILLEMWESILQVYPNAVLCIYTDLGNEWFKTHYPDIRVRIINLLYKYLNRSIIYFGWVGKEHLIKAWVNADIWLYPCVWEETFCLTALEAAASRTLAVTSDLAALKETVGDRGILISGNPETQEWKDEALKQIQKALSNKVIYDELIQSNYRWAKEHRWTNNPIINIVEHHLEYRNVFNWTIDYPVASKNIIGQILRDVVQVDAVSNLFLDVCSHTGTVGIELLKMFRGHCIMIDTNTVYPSFQNNLKLTGLSQKIRFYNVSKHNSFLDILQKLYKDNEEPIVIHMDICNYLKQIKNEYELVCVLSVVWSLLKVKGLLILYTEHLPNSILEAFFNTIVKTTGQPLYIQDNGYVCIRKSNENTLIIEEES